MNFLDYLFPSVDSILSDFQRKVSRLQDLAQRHTEKGWAVSDEITRLSFLERQHKDESQRALNVANKIQELIN